MADNPLPPVLLEPVPHDKWTVDKRVQLAIVVPLSLNLLAGIWFAADVNRRLKTVETIVEGRNPLVERLYGVENDVRTIRADAAVRWTALDGRLQRIEDKLDILTIKP